MIDRMRRLLAALLLLTMGACAGGPAPTDPRDPFEATNRDILDFNLKVDRAVLQPVALFYRDNVGNWTRTRIRNVLENIQEPRIAINHLLQGKPVAAGTATMRFFINTIGGIGGMFDLASIGGPPRTEADFGQTLAGWGVGDGPYLMVPVTGPSNPRDLTGTIVDGFLNPIGYLTPTGVLIGASVGRGVDQRAENNEVLEELKASSIDFYARLRSLARQLRDRELGRTSSEGGNLDVLDDPEPNPGINLPR
jgi:phospholipid-binding lipoprotein MlaA